jgi:hypothetical protein
MHVQAKVLLGWMPRDIAIKFLREQCEFDPPLDEAAAEAMWTRYRDEVGALGNRDVSCPRLPLAQHEEVIKDRVLKAFRATKRFPNVRDVIKLDPMQLVIWQMQVVLDKAHEYDARLNAPAKWREECLSPPSPTGPRANYHVGPRSLREWNYRVEIPHSEFGLEMADINNVRVFAVSQWSRYVSVGEHQGRTLLWAGYHRTYSRTVKATNDGADRSLLMVLATDADVVLLPSTPNQAVRAMICGLRPPLFKDFFDDRFCIEVPLRKKRYEIQITAQRVEVPI